MNYSGGRDNPQCAKIWEFIYSLKGEYERYAENIEDICAKDALSDSHGLTVIIPDKEFMNIFTKNIHGNGSASKARRMLMNTICRKYLPNTEALEQFGSALPFRSGLTLKIHSVDPSKNEALLQDQIYLKLRSDFTAPRGFKYAIWEVKKGHYPTDVSYTPHQRDKKKVRKVRGGVLETMGISIRESRDTKRISLVASILSDYKKYILKPKGINPLLLKCVSLYNWLKMYAESEILNEILLITDPHPGVNLLLLLLDPRSVLSDEILFGDTEAEQLHRSKGWNNCIVSSNPHQEWINYINQSSQWTKDHKSYFKSLIKIRNDFISNDVINNGQLNQHIIDKYRELIKNMPLDSENKEIFLNRYNDIHRKVWEDQLRYIAITTLSSYEGNHNLHSADEIVSSLQSVICFRPLGPDYSYTTAASFTNDSDQFMSQSNTYLIMKWLFSTSFLYMPDKITGLLERNDNKPYNGVIDAHANTTSIINCHKISYRLVKDNEKQNLLSAEIKYGIDWALMSKSKNRTDVDVEVQKVDDFISGGRIRRRNRSVSRRRGKVVQRGNASSEEEDDYEKLAHLTFMANPKKNTIPLDDDVDCDNYN